MAYLKPQSPLQHKDGDYFYPLTTADQVILPDGSRLHSIYSTVNYLDNSNFEQFVAQSDIGGLHGTQAYAGDRWILDSGTITGVANENGDGYSNITLNGTIRQIVANPPDTGTVVIEMVSGTASASYANGEVTVISSGGVIKNVALYACEDSIATLFKYRPKGYGVELAECMRYYVRLSFGFTRPALGFVTNTTTAMVTIFLPIDMRKDGLNPTVNLSGMYVSTPSSIGSNSKLITSVSDTRINGNVLNITVTASELATKEPCHVQQRTDNGYIEISLDL